MKATKSQAPAIVVIPALRAHVTAIKAAYKSAQSANQKIGAAVIAAAGAMKADQVESFVAMCKDALAGVLAEGSIKVEATRIRRVLTAIIAGDIEPSEGDTLRTMYDACPKGNTGAPKKGASHGTDKPEKPKQGDTVTLKGDPVEQAAILLFGTAEAYTDALRYARDNAVLFQAWAHASMRAKEQSAPATVTQLKAETATGKRATTKRARKAA